MWFRPLLRTLFPFLAVLVAVQAASPGQGRKITPAQAKDYIGQAATVCGKVASTKYAFRSRGQPTFLNLEKPYPNQVFTVVIWGADRPKFGQPEVTYQNVRICASGTITSYRGVPQIVATEPSQIKLAE